MADDEDLWRTVSEALAPISHLANAEELRKDEKRIRDYFKKAAKSGSINFKKGTWRSLIDEYADSVLGSLFQGIGERSWLEKVDFLLVMDAGVRAVFPQELLASVPQDEFEKAVLAAHDRAFEEQRYLPHLWEATQEYVHAVAGPKAKKKVYEAATLGRQAAMADCDMDGDQTQVKEFLNKWLDTTIMHLNRMTQGDLGSAMTEEKACEMFKYLVDKGSLPIELTVANGHAPPQWPYVDYVVNLAYTTHDETGETANKKLKCRGVPKSVGTPKSAGKGRAGTPKARPAPKAGGGGGGGSGTGWPTTEAKEEEHEEEEAQPTPRASWKPQIAQTAAGWLVPTPRPPPTPPPRNVLTPRPPAHHAVKQEPYIDAWSTEDLQGDGGEAYAAVPPPGKRWRKGW